jgi:hypothetical protein
MEAPQEEVLEGVFGTYGFTVFIQEVRSSADNP